MQESTAAVRKLLRQQAAIAEFGSFALRQTELSAVLTEAARVCAGALEAPFAKVCRYRASEDDLLIEAGFGWRAGVIGHVVSPADRSSPQGLAFTTGEPFVRPRLREDDSFTLPAFYAEHGIKSTIDVVICGSGRRPYGVLEVDHNEYRDYDDHDIDFVTSFANVVAEAVDTSERTALMTATIEEMKRLVQEKDRLLDEKKILAEELQHRVRNNLQLVYGMLSRQLSDTTDGAGQQGLKAIARRVSTLAQVYDHLLGAEMTRTTDFGGYVKSLCVNLHAIQAAADGAVTLTCNCAAVMLDLDVVTALGIIVAELVTNSYDHAFPNGRGSITVQVRYTTGDAKGTLIVADDGSGYAPNPESKRHGLGLVRRLVEQVHGTVTFGSAHGSRATIQFPTGEQPIGAKSPLDGAALADGEAKPEPTSRPH